MILLKKKIIFLQIKTKSITKNLYWGIIYYFTKNRISLLFNNYNYKLWKQYVISNSLKYFYDLKWNSYTSHIVRTKINSLITFCTYFLNFSLNKVYIYPNSWHFLSVLRSPFVYKKSMEQFSYKKHKITCTTNIYGYDFFFENYQFNFLKKEFSCNSVWKFFCKITFLSK